MKVRKILLLTVSGLSVILLLSAGLLFGIAYRSQYGAFIAQRGQLIDRLPAVLEDLKLLNENPPFPENSYSADAGPLLSLHVSFAGKGIAPLDSPDHQTLRKLMEEYRDWRKDPAVLAGLLSDRRLLSLRTDWLEELPRFDHWNILAAERIRQALEKVPAANGIGRIGIASSLPLPDYVEFRQWALAHALRMHKRGKNPLGVLRHSALLAHTSGTLIGAMTAVQLLQDERHLAENWKLRGWKTVPDLAIEAYRRASWAWAGLAALPIFGNFPAVLIPYLKPSLGLCAGVMEAGFSSFWNLQDFFGPRIPFEPDFRFHLKRVRDFQLAQNARCHFFPMNIFLSPTTKESNPWKVNGQYELLAVDGEPDVKFPDWQINLSRIPFVRRWVGLVLMNIARPDYLRMYADKQ